MILRRNGNTRNLITSGFDFLIKNYTLKVFTGDEFKRFTRMAYHWTDALRRKVTGGTDAPQIDAAMDCPPCKARTDGNAGAATFPPQQMGQTSFDDPHLAQRG